MKKSIKLKNTILILAIIISGITSSTYADDSEVINQNSLEEAITVESVEPFTQNIITYNNTIEAINADGSSTNHTVDTPLPNPNVNGIINIIANGVYEINGTITNNPIIVNENLNNVIIVLSGATLTTSTGPTESHPLTRSPLTIERNSNVTLILRDGTENKFEANLVATTRTSISAGIKVRESASLTILAGVNNSGKLTALSGTYGAGIGGGTNQNCGNITISGGTVIAIAREHVGSGIGTGNGAGIGGGGGNSGFGGVSDGITINGKASVNATSQGHGAGIGGGGGGNDILSSPPPAGGGHGGNISISGKASVEAISQGHGAGIGGGGRSDHKLDGEANDTFIAGDGGNISISEKAYVDAKTLGNGAAIGGGGSNNGDAGDGGNIIISGDATIIATATKNGASIGGGGGNGIGTNNPLNNGDGGSGGNIIITDNAKITATSELNGATIGGGGSFLGQAGATGTINIDGNATITTKNNSSLPNSVEIGPGINNSNISGTAGIITIISGSVFAQKTSNSNTTNVTNNPYGGDSLLMVEITESPNRQLTYNIHGSTGSYNYTATSNSEGKAYLWLIPGQLLIVYKDQDNDNILGSDTVMLSSGINTTINAIAIQNYTLVDPDSTSKEVLWNGDLTALSPIVFYYKYNTEDLILEAWDYSTNSNTGISVTIPALPINKNYNYLNNITDPSTGLTALIEAAYPNKYIELPQSSTLHYTVDGTNVVKVYYMQKQTSAIPVEARIGTIDGTIITKYTVPTTSLGEVVTLGIVDAPNFTEFGYILDTDASVLTATEGTLEKIIFVYTDDYFTTTISNNIDTTVITNTTIPGKTELLYPPHKDKYLLTSYSIDGGVTKIPVASNFIGYTANISTDIIFYYTALQTNNENIELFDGILYSFNNFTIRVSEVAELNEAAIINKSNLTVTNILTDSIIEMELSNNPIIEQVGTYTITFTDQDSNTLAVDIIVTVIDDNIPIITANNDEIVLEVGSTLPTTWTDLFGVIAMDSLDGNITENIVYDLNIGNIELDKIGNYIVTATITNSLGYTSTKILTLTITKTNNVEDNNGVVINNNDNNQVTPNTSDINQISLVVKVLFISLILITLILLNKKKLLSN